MPASPCPDPDGTPGASSRWERQALARIEAGLVRGDPRVARRMGCRGRQSGAWGVRGVSLLATGIAGSVAARVLVPASWLAVLALVLTLLVLPCLLLLATERRSGRRCAPPGHDVRPP